MLLDIGDIGGPKISSMTSANDKKKHDDYVQSHQGSDKGKQSEKDKKEQKDREKSDLGKQFYLTSCLIDYENLM
jgi:hypothetical protein